MKNCKEVLKVLKISKPTSGDEGTIWRPAVDRRGQIHCISGRSKDKLNSMYQFDTMLCETANVEHSVVDVYRS
jgi:hypothetical protein